MHVVTKHDILFQFMKPVFFIAWSGICANDDDDDDDDDEGLFNRLHIVALRLIEDYENYLRIIMVLMKQNLHNDISKDQHI